MVDAEIRRLTYVQRYAGAAPGMGANLPAATFGGDLPFLRKQEPQRPISSVTDLRLEGRIAELERERAETEQRHREQLTALEQKAAAQLESALREQAERAESAASASIRNAVSAFSQAREEYFASAETAVVRLALGVASRVLHREAQLDPLMLRGPVRVAIENLPQNTACVLEVAADMVEAWTSWLSVITADDDSVIVRGKADAPAGYCRLEVGSSSAELSVHAQMAEIERGFFDLLEQRSARRVEVLAGVSE